jgi:CheY-like chemotaxis protein
MNTAELQMRFAAGERHSFGVDQHGADLHWVDLTESGMTEAIRKFRCPQRLMRPAQSLCEGSFEGLRKASGWCLDGQMPHQEAEFGSIFPDQPMQLRVLLVEDDADIANRMALLLRLWGHNTQVCHTGSEALEAAAAYQPNVVLLDIGLADMDGFQLARRLREQPGLTKAVLISITGFGDESHRRRAKEEGFDDSLIKAVNPHQLEELLLKIVGDSRELPVAQGRQESGHVSLREHAAVLETPDQFDSLHRRNDFLAEGVHTVFGVKDGEAQLQAFYFPADQFTPPAATEWLQERGLEPFLFTEATESRA